MPNGSPKTLTLIFLDEGLSHIGFHAGTDWLLELVSLVSLVPGGGWNLPRNLPRNLPSSSAAQERAVRPPQPPAVLEIAERVVDVDPEVCVRVCSYFLAFDDDEEEGVDGLPQRQVPFYHTVNLPQGHRQ